MARVSGESRYLKVSCPTGLFRRAGLAFGTEPVVLDREELDDAQLEAIEAEELLEVEETDELPQLPFDQDAPVDPSEVQALRDEASRLADVVAANEQLIDQLTNDGAAAAERFKDDLAKVAKERDDAVDSAARQRDALEASKGREADLESKLKAALEEVDQLKTKIASAETPASTAPTKKAKGDKPAAETPAQ